MRTTLFALAIATVMVGPSFAQAPPPAPGVGPAAEDAAPPPPGGPGVRRPPPPPHGAAVEIERGGPNGLRIAVHCADRDTTQECVSMATALLDKAAKTAGTGDTK